LFEDSQIIQRTNYVTYKVQNFMSDVGGLIGLFLGFSLLSLFELLLRMCSYLKRVIQGWIGKLKQKLSESRVDGALTEIITVKEFRSAVKRSEVSSQNESVSVISDAILQTED
jgi:pilus assembly protein TadC